MACFHPVPAYRTAAGEVVFAERAGVDSHLTLPCGQCVGCRVARARAWSLRCVHEAALHKFNCFLTLTYRPSDLPPGGSLRYRDFQLFMKRLRKAAKAPVRFFVCGEYGDQLSRPHYHACLFGYDFPDKKPATYLGKPGTWTSSKLDQLWQLGHTHLGELNVRSAGYAARYCLKKVTGDLAAKHYERVDQDGVVHHLEPEFARMSLRPGVGAEWFGRFRSDVVNRDYVIHDGSSYPVPRYYDRLLERDDPNRLAEMKEDRETKAIPLRPDATPARLAVREEVERARLTTLKRDYENDSTLLRRP